MKKHDGLYFERYELVALTFYLDYEGVTKVFAFEAVVLNYYKIFMQELIYGRSQGISTLQ